MGSHCSAELAQAHESLSHDVVAVNFSDDLFTFHAQVVAQDEVVVSGEVGLVVLIERCFHATPAAVVSTLTKEGNAITVESGCVPENLVQPFVCMTRALLVMDQLLIPRCHLTYPRSLRERGFLSRGDSFSGQLDRREAVSLMDDPSPAVTWFCQEVVRAGADPVVFLKTEQDRLCAVVSAAFAEERCRVFLRVQHFADPFVHFTEQKLVSG
jgi:hypothetical protein